MGTVNKPAVVFALLLVAALVMIGVLAWYIVSPVTNMLNLEFKHFYKVATKLKAKLDELAATKISVVQEKNRVKQMITDLGIKNNTIASLREIGRAHV